MATTHQQGQPAVHRQLEPVIAALGLVLDDVVVVAAGARPVLRVVLDLPQDSPGALSLDMIADAAREISAVLDEADPMGQSPYTLEVSSPGVERPLTTPRHLRRNITRVVTLTLRDGAELTGRVLSVEDDDTLVLLLPGAKKGMPATKQRRVEWDQVVQGVVQVEFNRPDGSADEPDEVDAIGDDDPDEIDDETDDDPNDGRS